LAKYGTRSGRGDRHQEEEAAVAGIGSNIGRGGLASGSIGTQKDHSAAS
jgi:hypothetical protein